MRSHNDVCSQDLELSAAHLYSLIKHYTDSEAKFIAFDHNLQLYMYTHATHVCIYARVNIRCLSLRTINDSCKHMCAARLAWLQSSSQI